MSQISQLSEFLQNAEKDCIIKLQELYISSEINLLTSNLENDAHYAPWDPCPPEEVSDSPSSRETEINEAEENFSKMQLKDSATSTNETTLMECNSCKNGENLDVTQVNGDEHKEHAKTSPKVSTKKKSEKSSKINNSKKLLPTFKTMEEFTINFEGYITFWNDTHSVSTGAFDVAEKKRILSNTIIRLGERSLLGEKDFRSLLAHVDNLKG